MKAHLLEGTGGLQKGPCLTADQGVALLGQIVVQEKGPDRGNEEDDADRGPEIETLHPDDLLVDLGGQDTVISTDHHGNAEVRDGEVKDECGGARNPVFRRRKRHLIKGLQGGSPQALGRLVQSGVDRREGGIKDEEGIGKTVETLCDDDPCGHHRYSSRCEGDNG